MGAALKLLLIEHDEATASYIAQGTGELGHSCDRASTGLDGLNAAMTYDYDAIILDHNLPRTDGLSVLAALRAERNETPVLMLSALGQVDDRVAGLNAGTDDYLAKSFSFQELIARLLALARRRETTSESYSSLTIGSLSLDRTTRSAKRDERRIDLRGMEYQFVRPTFEAISKPSFSEAVMA